VQHAPHLDDFWGFEVEDEIRKAFQCPGAQARQPEFVGVAGRPGPGMASEVEVPTFQLVHE